MKGLLLTILLVIYLLLIVVWAILVVVAMGVVLLFTFPFDKERKAILALSRPAARMVYLLSPVWRVTVEGRENVVPGKRYVITVNHQSFFDIPLAFFLPIWKFKFVSKVEVKKIPAIGWILGMRGDIAIRRGTSGAATAVMTEGGEHLKVGTSVLLFPEGTRTKDGEIHRYKDGAFRLAAESGTDILPCVMYGTRGLFNGKRLQPRRLVIRILDPIASERVVSMPAREIAEEVRACSEEALADIRRNAKK
jgi:1-acyl-sn-glycerol-3-phosphate acyltransferase